MSIVPDPTNNPLDRLRLAVDPERRAPRRGSSPTRWPRGSPPVIVRDHEVEHGSSSSIRATSTRARRRCVADRILEELARARTSHTTGMISAAERRARRFERLLRWPD